MAADNRSSKGFWWGLGCGCGLPLLLVVLLLGSCFGMLAWTGMQFDSEVDEVVDVWNREDADALYDMASSRVRESFGREELAESFASGRRQLGSITGVGWTTSVNRKADGARHTVDLRVGLDFEAGSGHGVFGFLKEGDELRLSVLQLSGPGGDQWGFRDPQHPEGD